MFYSYDWLSWGTIRPGKLILYNKEWGIIKMSAIFQHQNNQLTTVSGADEGTYMIKDNEATIPIGEVEYVGNPLSKIPNGDNDMYLSLVAGSLVSVEITEDE